MASGEPVTSNTTVTSASAADVPATAPAVTTVAPGPTRATTAGEVLRYVVPVIDFLGIIFAPILAFGSAQYQPAA